MELPEQRGLYHCRYVVNVPGVWMKWTRMITALVYGYYERLYTFSLNWAVVSLLKRGRRWSMKRSSPIRQYIVSSMALRHRQGALCSKQYSLILKPCIMRLPSSFTRDPLTILYAAKQQKRPYEKHFQIYTIFACCKSFKEMYYSSHVRRRQPLICVRRSRIYVMSATWIWAALSLGFAYQRTANELKIKIKLALAFPFWHGRMCLQNKYTWQIFAKMTGERARNFDVRTQPH